MKNELINIVKKTLKEQVKRPGSVLYSKPDTLHKGNFYLLGFNPGGDDNISIEKNLYELHSKPFNNYLEGTWENQNKKYDKGKHPLQKRVKFLFDELKDKFKINLELKKVCASNLIFFSSKDQSQVNYPEDANRCWPVHEFILNLVNPEVIIAFGNDETSSTYSFLRLLAQNENNEKYFELEPIVCGYRKKCKAFRGIINEKLRLVIGLPHLSMYHINNKKHSNVIKWIAGQVKTYVD